MSEAFSQLNGLWRSLSEAMGLKTDVPPGAKSGLGRVLWTDPRPLIDPERRMIVVFSPKSACTTVLVWFLHQLGHAKAAQDYHRWPHRYRTDVYYKSRLYRLALELDLSQFSLVRIVRDPLERAVSSFRHVQRSGLADRPLSRLLKRRDIATSGLSFCEFLDYLETCDVTTCNPHFRLQRHPIEDHLPTRHVINASREDLFTRLNAVEADFGMPLTDFDRLDWLHTVNSKHAHVDAPVVPTDPYTHRFTRQEARKGSWPRYAAFLTPLARERIARIYAADIEAYAAPAATPARKSDVLAAAS